MIRRELQTEAVYLVALCSAVSSLDPCGPRGLIELTDVRSMFRPTELSRQIPLAFGKSGPGYSWHAVGHSPVYRGHTVLPQTKATQT